MSLRRKKQTKERVLKYQLASSKQDVFFHRDQIYAHILPTWIISIASQP